MKNGGGLCGQEGESLHCQEEEESAQLPAGNGRGRVGKEHMSLDRKMSLHRGLCPTSKEETVICPFMTQGYAIVQLLIQQVQEVGRIAPGINKQTVGLHLEGWPSWCHGT